MESRGRAVRGLHVLSSWQRLLLLVACIVVYGTPAVALAPQRRTLSRKSTKAPQDAPATEASGDGALDEVHVAYGNAHNFTGLLSSMLSLARHLEQPEKCVIHVIVGMGDMEMAESMVECFKRELGRAIAIPKVHLHDVLPVPFNNSRSAQKHLNGIDVVYARLYLPWYMPHVGRVIWLDTDTIIKSDIGALYRMPMRHAIAAVLQTDDRSTFETLYMWKDKRLPEYVKDPANTHVFNDGVLLIDLDRWQKENLSGAIERWTGKLDLLDDQLLLNLLFGNSFDHLDLEWNTFNLGCKSYNWNSTVMNRGKILHWSGGWKPWIRINKTKMGNDGKMKSWWGGASFQEYYRPEKPRQECTALYKVPGTTLKLH